MSLPDRETAKNWVDRVVVDADGAELGTCARVYADLDTGAPEWLLVSRPDHGGAVVPLLNASEDGDRVRVQVAADQVASAPRPAGEERLSTEEEAALYRHYGVEFSETTSGSILPSEVTEADTPSETELPAAADTADLPPVDAEPVDSEPVDSEPVKAEPVDAFADTGLDDTPPAGLPPVETPSVDSPPVVTGSDEPAKPAPTPTPPPARTPAPAAWQPDLAPSTSAGGNSKVVAISGALAAVLGLLLARRRRRARRSAPTKASRRASRRDAKAVAGAVRGLTPAQVAARAAAARAAAATNVTAARTAAATNVTAARTAAATNLAVGKAASATSLAKTKAAAATKTAAAQAAANAKMTAAGTAAAVGSGGLTAGKFGAQVAGKSVRLGARGAAGAGRSGRELARNRRQRRRNRKVALRAIKSTGGNVTAGATRVKKSGRSTMGKIKTGLTLGAGYVLGTRAGRQRYEQIRRVSATVAQRPEVQRTTHRVTGVVASKLPPAVASKLPLGTSGKLPNNPPTAPQNPTTSY